MDHQSLNRHHQAEIARLFDTAFTASEGEQEGRMVSGLARDLALIIDGTDVLCFGARRQRELIGCIFFSRLFFDHPTRVMMLSPVAVRTQDQGRGVGQALIGFGLERIRSLPTDVAVTYGDPGFYGKLGFQPLSENILQAPMPLAMPHGWLGQPLNAAALVRIDGRPDCVTPFQNPDYW